MSQAIAGTSKLLCCCDQCCPVTLITRVGGYLEGTYLDGKLAFYSEDCSGVTYQSGTAVLTARFKRMDGPIVIWAEASFDSPLPQLPEAVFSHWELFYTRLDDLGNQVTEWEHASLDRMYSMPEIPLDVIEVFCWAAYHSSYDYYVFIQDASWPYAYCYTVPHGYGRTHCGQRPLRTIQLVPDGYMLYEDFIHYNNAVPIYYAREEWGGPHLIAYEIPPGPITGFAFKCPDDPAGCVTAGQCHGSYDIPYYYYNAGDDYWQGGLRYCPGDPTRWQTHDDGHTYQSCVWTEWQHHITSGYFPHGSLEVWRFDEPYGSDEWCSQSQAFVNKQWHYPNVTEITGCPRAAESNGDADGIDQTLVAYDNLGDGRIFNKREDRCDPPGKDAIAQAVKEYRARLGKHKLRAIARATAAKSNGMPRSVGPDVVETSQVVADPRLVSSASERMSICAICKNFIKDERNCALLKRPGAECSSHYRRLLSQGFGHPSAECPWNRKG